MKLLLPVAGKSSRYPDLRPKWLLTLPDGQLMIEKSLSGISKKNIDEIVIIMLEDHLKFISIVQLNDLIASKLDKEIELTIFTLDKPTLSQPATIANYLKSIKKDFPLFIKDSDNFFNFEPSVLDGVSFINLSNVENINVNNKSYIQTNRFEEVEKIVEKKIISDKLCCGGYSFASSLDFLNTFNQLDGDSNDNLYISHIIQKQILDGKNFKSLEAENYQDYGTYQDYKKFMKKTKSLFCDFDGTLVKNSSKFDNPPWKYEPIQDNLELISKFLKTSPYSKLIITTSRPNSEIKNIQEFLKSYKISCHAIITDLPHSSRLLINDFAKSNPYPSAEAINIQRNSKDLSDYLSQLND